MKYALLAAVIVASFFAGVAYRGAQANGQTFRGVADPSPQQCLDDILDRCEVLSRVSEYHNIENVRIIRNLGGDVLCAVAERLDPMQQPAPPPEFFDEYLYACDLIHEAWPWPWGEECVPCRR